MFCVNCGSPLPENSGCCPSCGSEVNHTPPGTALPAITRGFSARISDPAFAKYVKSANRWAVIIPTILSVAAIIGFYIAGEKQAEGLTNPGSLFIGFAIGIMFLLVGLVQIISRKRSKTWDGTVEKKKVKKKTARHSYGDDFDYESYLLYYVIIRSDYKKRYMLKTRDNELYNYYNIGDRVRHHAGLNTYEKYDKTGDAVVPCSACSTLCEISEDYCFRCQCPLLK